MNMRSVSQLALVPAVVTLLLAGMPVQAATASTTTPVASHAARAKYASDTARCRTLPVQSTARANCLSEASTVFAQTQPEKREEAPSLLVQNAMRRCDPLPPTDKQACLARMSGAGTVSGSVAAGGILRELVTREVIIDPAALPPTAAGPAASGVAAPPVTMPVTPAPQPVSPAPLPTPQPVSPAPPVEQVPPAGYPPPPMRPTL